MVMEKTLDIYLTRHHITDQGTEGILSVPSLFFSCLTFELPWRNNLPNISCIPEGSYRLTWRSSRKKPAYHIRNVPNRSYILIHSGNFAGDAAKGFKTHVQGCVLLGQRMCKLGGQRAVLVSRNTVRRFNRLLKGKEARIIIKDLCNG